MTISIEGLTVRYRAAGGDVTALADVSLSVAAGRTLAIVGESGSGKSTIALAIMGLLPPEAEVVSGRILFQGRDLLMLDAESRRSLRGAHMALVFQDPFSVLNPSMRVGDQVGEALVYHRGFSREAAFARSVELLREVGIAEAPAVAAAYPHELSGGMRQRALIAGALSTGPQLLILDEPTTALDVTIEAQILDLMDELQARRGLTSLFITHNLGVVRRVAHEVAVLYASEIVEQGATADVFSGPAHPYTRGLMSAVPRLSVTRARLAAIPGRLPDLRNPAAACRFAPRCPFATAPCQARQVLREAARRAVRCCRIEEIRDAPWPSPAHEGPAVTRPPPAKSDPPAADGRGLAKTFTLSRGLSAWSFAGGRLRYRPVRIHAVDGVDLTIRRGEVVGLVGESGSGKSTLGRLMLRLQDADRGQIRIDGQDVTATPQRALVGMRKAAQIVFQNADSSLNPRKTVGEIIGRPLRRFDVVSAAEVTRRVKELLDLVRLPSHYAHRYPHQLSGGEKQRVGIARALAPRPRLIVCDEPVSALDVSVQAAIVNLLADLKAELGVAYLFISHDIAVVAHLADRIAVMYRGRIVEEGPAEALIARPSHPYTEALLSAVPQLGGEPTVRIRLALEPRRGGNTMGCVFAGRCHRQPGDICNDTPPPVRNAGEHHRYVCHLEVPHAGLSK